MSSANIRQSDVENEEGTSLVKRSKSGRPKWLPSGTPDKTEISDS